MLILEFTPITPKFKMKKTIAPFSPAAPLLSFESPIEIPIANNNDKNVNSAAPPE